MDALGIADESYHGLGRAKPRPTWTCRFPSALATSDQYLVIGLAGFLLFTAIAVISNVFANATTNWKTTTVFVGFALLALPILGDYFAARHEISEEGLRYGRLIGSGGYMPWTELKSVRFSEAMKWFRLESQSGKVVRLSVMLMGLPTFAQLLLAHAPPQSVEKNTRPVLQTTAEGNPPSVWGAPGTQVTFTDFTENDEWQATRLPLQLRTTQFHFCSLALRTARTTAMTSAWTGSQ